MSTCGSWVAGGGALLLGIAGCVVQTGSSVPAASPPPAAHASGAEVVVTEGSPAPVQVEASAPSAPPSEPIHCSANQDLAFEDVVIDAPGGTAVHAEGNCTVVLRRCRLSGQAAVVVSGNGDVVLEGCSVHGDPTAFVVDGNGTLRLVGTTVEGAESVSGNGDVVRQ